MQAWNLGAFFKKIEITAQITAVLSAQDFSNTLQTTCNYLPKENFACIPHSLSNIKHKIFSHLEQHFS